MPRLAADFLTRPIAHRGLHDAAAGRIENSAAAIRAAVAAGYGIEIDVQVARDTTPVVFHDATLNRLTDTTGKVAERDAWELAKVHLAGSDDTIPTLAEVLQMVDGQVPLLVELKATDGPDATQAGPLPAAVAQVLAGYDGPVAVMSFSPVMMAAYVAVDPAMPVGLVTMDFTPLNLAHDVCVRLNTLADLGDLNAAFVSCRWQDLDRAPVAQVRARNLPVFCWTILSQAEAEAAAPLSDNITFEGFLPPVHPPSSPGRA